ncbi:probable LRR receptor-like serine/threonine-protein kinase At3g47570 [Camellia sinensis]|uniref:probable LRR receptor-like serine/threonine-protein kinase At3g47570 n=1 Tax=Camellia sinensis TaxID=4442 RepID=UPI001036F0B9|nr:probable LRR receptor-like serine/threonine-protein kinase At3g47570 [Camellia sinensis]
MDDSASVSAGCFSPLCSAPKSFNYCSTTESAATVSYSASSTGTDGGGINLTLSTLFLATIFSAFFLLAICASDSPAMFSGSASAKPTSGFTNKTDREALIAIKDLIGGNLPNSIGNLSSTLTSVWLGQNYISRNIPQEITELVGLSYITIDTNMLIGSIPDSIGKLTNLQEFNLFTNNISGKIPYSIGNISGLASLILEDNMLEHSKPVSLGNCSNLQGLHLAQNCLTSSILGKVVGLSSRYLGFVVCQNYLTGPLPSQAGKLENLVSLEISENKLFGEIPNNFIGKGRYGSVYKGILTFGEQTVAVKVLNFQESGADKSFLAECEALRNLRHRNLVKVITSCLSLDFKGNDLKTLVFEFMSNGSLESWLYPSSTEQNDTKNLNLTHRLNIAIDVASALEYLHHHYDIPIAHCDLKPSNVRLDNNLCIRVGDFGLARFLLATTGDTNYAQSSSIGIRGTVGYVALGN